MVGSRSQRRRHFVSMVITNGVQPQHPNFGRSHTLHESEPGRTVHLTRVTLPRHLSGLGAHPTDQSRNVSRSAGSGRKLVGRSRTCKGLRFQEIETRGLPTNTVCVILIPFPGNSSLESRKGLSLKTRSG